MKTSWATKLTCNQSISFMEWRTVSCYDPHSGDTTQYNTIQNNRFCSARFLSHLVYSNRTTRYEGRKAGRQLPIITSLPPKRQPPALFSLTLCFVYLIGKASEEPMNDTTTKTASSRGTLSSSVNDGSGGSTLSLTPSHKGLTRTSQKALTYCPKTCR